MLQNKKAPHHGNGVEAENCINSKEHSSKIIFGQPSKRLLVLEHLLDGDSITPKFALENFGLMSLSSRICELRQDGFFINTILVEVEDAFGRRSRVAEYSIPEEFLEEARELEKSNYSNKLKQGVIPDY